MGKIEGLQIGHSIVKERDFKIECEVMDNINVEVPFSHKHCFYSIYWIHEGCGTHIIDFEEYAIKPDRIFFVKPEQVHYMRDVVNMKYSAIQFTEEFMMPFITDKHWNFTVSHDMDKNERNRISILFSQLESESRGNLPNHITLIQSEINTMLLDLERMNIGCNSSSDIPDLINRYICLINNDFAKNHQVNYYASILGISPNYLNVITRKFLGKSALSLINDRVILEIKRSLIRNDLNISEIAYQLGFNELSYFSRFFKQKTGMTPLEFKTSMNKMYQN